MNFSDCRIPVLSFYSGGGFLDMGFEKAGFEIVWTNEFDKDFAKLHAAGITSWRKASGIVTHAEIFNTKSITDISSEEIVREAFPEGKPENFGIIGGPPCQDFSMNGKRKGFNGERGKLTIVYLNKIIDLQPAFFVMENVPGLVKGQSTREHLARILEEVGEKYHFDYKILNAIEYGVPQSRERVFFIGIHKSRLKSEIVNRSIGNWFNYPVNQQYTNALRKYKWPSKNSFGLDIEKPNDIPLNLCVESCLIKNEDIGSIPNANEFFNLYKSDRILAKIEEGETNRPSFKRLHRYKFSPTACYGNNEVHLHPYENRRLSVRETLRIQGVEDSYILPPEIPLSKKFKMIGNGVPVPLAEAVAKSVRSFIIEHGVLQLLSLKDYSA
jgi:DNA (cytosine-5)-methyltransferase 1